MRKFLCLFLLLAAGAVYAAMAQSTDAMFEALGIPKDQVRDAWNTPELKLRAEQWYDTKLRFESGIIGIYDVWDRELAALRALMSQPEVAASPLMPDLYRAYSKRLKQQLDMLKAEYETGYRGPEPIRKKELEISEFRKRHGLPETPEDRHRRMLAEGYRRFDLDGASYHTVIYAAIDHRGKISGYSCSHSPVPAFDGIYVRISPAMPADLAQKFPEQKDFPYLSLRVATADMRFTGANEPLAGVTAWAFAPTKRLGKWFFMKTTTVADKKFRSKKWDELAPGEVGYLALPMEGKDRPDQKKIRAVIEKSTKAAFTARRRGQ